MSDEALIMMTGLWVAFCCAVSEAALRRQSGVNYVGKADDFRNGLSGHGVFRGLHRHGDDCGSDAMTDKHQETDESRGQVIDFFDARCRRDWARYARDNGLRRAPDVRGQ